MARHRGKGRDYSKDTQNRGSQLEETFLAYWKLFAADFPEPVREFKFLKKRKFRADFAWTDYKVLVEIEGGEWSGGRHVSGKGYNKDCEKYNLASLECWSLLRFTGTMIRNNPMLCIEQTKQILVNRGYK